MNLMTYDQRIDAVVEEYRSQGTQDNAVHVKQCEKILLILAHVYEHEWDMEASVDWDMLLQCMTAWSDAWNVQILQRAQSQNNSEYP